MITPTDLDYKMPARANIQIVDSAAVYQTINHLLLLFSALYNSNAIEPT